MATPYLIPEIHLLFTASSFRRLLQVSQHPIISQHVTSLYYEPDLLSVYYSFDEWETSIHDDDWLRHIPNLLRPGATERDRRINRRDINKFSTFKKTFLCEAYEKYTKLVMEQLLLQDENFGAEILLAAMKNLPNLSDIIMSLGSGVDKLSGYSRNAFRPVLQNAFGDRSETDRPGIRQVLSVFQAAHHAHLELDELRLGHVDWKTLQPGEDWNMIKEVVKQVRLLEFNMSTGHDKATDEFGADIPERRQLISTGRLHELISGAATLEALSLCFDWNEPQSPA